MMRGAVHKADVVFDNDVLRYTVSIMQSYFARSVHNSPGCCIPFRTTGPKEVLTSNESIQQARECVAKSRRKTRVY